MQHLVLTSAMSVKSSLEYTTLGLGKSAVLTCWGVGVVLLSCSSAAQPSRAWLHELRRSTALSHDYAVTPSIASKKGVHTYPQPQSAVAPDHACVCT